MKGCATGVLAATALSVAGAVSGAIQVSRGMIAAPYACRASVKGQDWDEKTGEYLDHVPYILRQEAAAILEEEQKASRMFAQSGRLVVETELYDMLSVTPTASAAEIKKAYRKMARTMHPDKNPDDPQAKEKFQMLGTAYQTLSDDRLRAKYDAEGRSVRHCVQPL